MPSITIEDPIINSPFMKPQRHFRFDDQGSTNQIVEGRRESFYFMPVARPRGQNRDQQIIESFWTENRKEENKFINHVRSRVTQWRNSGLQMTSVTPVTRQLLEYWKNKDREKRLYFCQIEAVETAIYLTEAAKKFNDAALENQLREFKIQGNSDLNRIAFKMATGSGKTLVMAMLMAWHVLNKLAYPQDNRFSDTFLIVTPGITIKDRLRVLLPNDPDNFYRALDIVPAELLSRMQNAKIVITNFHAFKQRERGAAGKLTKSILNTGKKVSAFIETPDQMVRRVCRSLGNKGNVIVINDEAHHCYRRKEQGLEEVLKGEEKAEAKKREEEARLWINGLEAVKRKLGVRAVYDLSATPFFLKGSGFSEGTLFPWVVSDFSLIDAIECGIVKVPRVPIEDNANPGQMPTYRNLWYKIRDDLPRKGRGSEQKTPDPKVPVQLEGALRSLYENYQKHYQSWEQNTEARARGLTQPVFIVVCNNTSVSKMVYDFISGYEKEVKGQKVVVPGKLDLFSNVVNNAWTDRPSTILVDSEELESGEAMSAEFKKVAAVEIEEFKREYTQRFEGRSAENLTDEDLLREVMNTIGKQGKLGEQVKCVVSVSMLTEGWDANTVTHILGVRAFGTQLLCEQVVGRGLRRMGRGLVTKTINGATFETYPVEYAEVYGVPFSFIPCAGSTIQIPIPVQATRVRALEERNHLEITFPRLAGYKYDMPTEKLTASFGPESKMELSTLQVPTITVVAPIVGQKEVHNLDELKAHRIQEVEFLLAKHVLEKYYRDDQGNLKQYLFPQVLGIVRQWLDGSVVLKDDTFIQLLLLIEHGNLAADKIYGAISKSMSGQSTIKPILKPYDTIGSTKHVDFDTTKPVFATSPDKCHISHVVADTESWEQKLAHSLEQMEQVKAYVKNQSLGFFIPYQMNGEEKNYIPDFIVRIDDGHGTPDYADTTPGDEKRLRTGKDDLLNLIVEVTGEKRADKEIKVATARDLWVPAVNNHGGFGRWKFLEIRDPWNAKNEIFKQFN